MISLVVIIVLNDQDLNSKPTTPKVSCTELYFTNLVSQRYESAGFSLLAQLGAPTSNLYITGDLWIMSLFPDDSLWLQATTGYNPDDITVLQVIVLSLLVLE
jgi:hypothetical protein